MAKIFTDAGQTPFNEANINKFVCGDGYTGGHFAAISYRIYYTGAAWSVHSTYGCVTSDSDVTVAWNAGDNRLDITLSSSLATLFSASYRPTILVSPTCPTTDTTPNYQPQAYTPSTAASYVRFIDLASPSAYVGTQSTRMDFYVTFYGVKG